MSFWDTLTDFDPSWSDRWMDRWLEPDWRMSSRPLHEGWERPSQALTARRRGADMTPSGTVRPRMDLHENAEKNTMTATFELPGLAKENININVHNERLEVSGESKVSKEYEEGGYAVRERRAGKFYRNISLPAGISEKDIKANFDNGILTITFPKATAGTEVKRIAIR
ncbi:hypothetical protein AX15_001006 [Amanita polypyramis BW_CC]|nr:hypothetical protein AX15_001006 [Amanita polypyramis BW_CC]